jgi:hypothetical protein
MSSTPSNPRHNRGYHGEQSMGFHLGERGYYFIEGPSGAGGHAANARGFDGVAYNPHKPCHHFLYSGGAFARLYPVNPSSVRNYAAKPKRRPPRRGWFTLDIWELVSVPYSRLNTPRM